MYAQKNMYVGLNFINAHDISQIKDDGDHFSSPLAYSPGFEFRIGHEIGPVFSLETGLILKEHKVLFTSPIIVTGHIHNFSGFHSMQFPVRLRGRWQIPETSIIISPVLGYRLGYSSAFRKDKTREVSDPDYTLAYTLDRNGDVFSSFAELGTDLEFKVSKRINLTTGISYVKGFKPITQSMGRYDLNTGIAQDFSVTTRGSYVGLNIGLKYTFNPHWIKSALQEVYDKGPQ